MAHAGSGAGRESEAAQKPAYASFITKSSSSAAAAVW